MAAIHTLLRRQLKRYFGATDGSTLAEGSQQAWNDFLAAVSTAYAEFDGDRRMLERSLEISSQELMQANTVMRAMLQDMCEAQASLQKQNQVLTELAKSPVVSGGDLDAAFRRLTESSADALSVERVGIWLLDEARVALRCSDLYERSAARHSSGMELAVGKYPRHFEALERERTISAQDALVDERTSELADSHLKRLGIGSVLIGSMWSGRRLVGVVSHAHVGAPRRWSPDDERFAASIADLACLAIEASGRQQTQQQLAAKLREVEMLNRVMMGREERILELKEELKRLKAPSESSP